MYWFMARSTGFSGLVPEDPEQADPAYLEDMLKVFFLGVRPR
jgi:hypothetical protein